MSGQTLTSDGRLRSAPLIWFDPTHCARPVLLHSGVGTTVQEVAIDVTVCDCIVVNGARAWSRAQGGELDAVGGPGNMDIHRVWHRGYDT